MMKDQKTLAVTILGRSYSLVTDENKEIIEEAALLVENCLKKMGAAAASPADLVKKTTFVALTMAVDLIKKENELQMTNEKAVVLNDLLKKASL